MSFLPAVNREIASRPVNDPVRITLEYMVLHGIGRHNAVPLQTIVNHLNSKGANVTTTGFQHTVLTESRSKDFYIGSGRRGYYLIDTIDDAKEMRNFYEARIQREQQNLDNLRVQSAQCGWAI